MGPPVEHACVQLPNIQVAIYMVDIANSYKNGGDFMYYKATFTYLWGPILDNPIYKWMMTGGYPMT